MVVIVIGYTLFVTSQHDVMFRFATNVFAKVLDIKCIFRDGTALGQGKQ